MSFYWTYMYIVHGMYLGTRYKISVFRQMFRIFTLWVTDQLKTAKKVVQLLEKHL